MEVYIDGKFYPKADAKISVFDHGLLYGDGIFEGIRVYENCIFRLDEHLERLEDSAKAIMMKMPWSREELALATIESCRRNGIVNGYIRLVITRGIGDLGLSPLNCEAPSLIIIAATIKLYPPEMYTNGMKLITVPTPRTGHSALPPLVKSLNYLNNIMAKVEGQLHGYNEVLMLNDQGYIAECSADNFFIIRKGKLYTPAGYAGALRGITRAVVMEIGEKLGMPVVETNLTRYEAWVADECFITGSGAEIVPIIEIDGRVIGDGKPGAHTANILKIFRTKVTKEGRIIEGEKKAAKKAPAKVAPAKAVSAPAKAKTPAAKAKPVKKK